MTGFFCYCFIMQIDKLLYLSSLKHFKSTHFVSRNIFSFNDEHDTFTLEKKGIFYILYLIMLLKKNKASLFLKYPLILVNLSLPFKEDTHFNQSLKF